MAGLNVYSTRKVNMIHPRKSNLQNGKRRKRKKHCPIVKVTWRDIEVDTNVSLNNPEKFQCPLATSAGYLLSQDKKRIVIVTTASHSGDKTNDVIKIPVGCVEEIKVLEK